MQMGSPRDCSIFSNGSSRCAEQAGSSYPLCGRLTTNRLGSVVLDGFSIYEVDWVFHGERLWEQRTLVIRILLVRKADMPLDLLDVTVLELGREIATKVAVREEQIWICHYAQNLRVFTGVQRLIS